MANLYRRWVVGQPLAVLGLVTVLLVAAALQLPKLRLDASSDSLLLQGDPDLAFFRETSRNYASSEFLVLTWAPPGDLLGPDSLGPLADMVDELAAVEGVTAVTSVLDVPLLESPPLGLSDLAEADAIATLRDPNVDRELALRELTTSPLYRNLVVSETGRLAAIQVTLKADPVARALVDEREDLRRLRREGALTPAQAQRLATVAAEYDELLARETLVRERLVADVRAVAARYRPYAQIFVGGVPMIAADMLAFVNADLVTFGSAILGIMAIALALIFGSWRWVLIPLLNCAATALLMLGLLAFTDWRMTVISSNFVAVLLIVTLSLSIHLVVRCRELEHNCPGVSRADRAAETARLMAMPCLYTAITTIVAFASLVVAGIQPVIDFGWMMTVGIVVGFLMTFTLVPTLMAILPGRLASGPARDDHSLTERLAGVVARYGNLIILGSLCLALATLVGVSRLKVENRFIDYFKESTEIYQGMELLDAQLGGTIPLDIVIWAPETGNPNTAPAAPLTAGTAPTGDAAPAAAPASGDPLADDAFAQEANSADTFAEDPFADDPFGDDPFGADAFADDASAAPSYWFTQQGRQVIDRVHALVAAKPESGKVLSLATAFEVLDGLFGARLGAVELALVQNSMPELVKGTLVDPYFAPEVAQARVTVRAMETSQSLRRDRYLREIRTALEEDVGLAPEQYRLTGLLVLYNNVLQSLFASQIMTLGVVFLAIGLMFWVLFGSLSLALLALVPNLLAAGMVLGIMGLVGIPLDIMTITIAAIVVGIGVDDCIHYIHRFRREFRVDGDYQAAMYRSHASIGRAMYYTTLTVVVGFSLLTLSNFTPSLYFGLLTVVAMLAAVAGALLLLPRLLLIFTPLSRT